MNDPRLRTRAVEDTKPMSKSSPRVIVAGFDIDTDALEDGCFGRFCVDWVFAVGEYV
jgi:hypothetical protein